MNWLASLVLCMCSVCTWWVGGPTWKDKNFACNRCWIVWNGLRGNCRKPTWRLSTHQSRCEGEWCICQRYSFQNPLRSFKPAVSTLSYQYRSKCIVETPGTKPHTRQSWLLSGYHLSLGVWVNYRWEFFRPLQIEAYCPRPVHSSVCPFVVSY